MKAASYLNSLVYLGVPGAYLDRLNSASHSSGVPLSQRLRERLATTIAEQEKQVEVEQNGTKMKKCGVMWCGNWM